FSLKVSIVRWDGSRSPPFLERMSCAPAKELVAGNPAIRAASRTRIMSRAFRRSFVIALDSLLQSNAPDHDHVPLRSTRSRLSWQVADIISLHLTRAQGICCPRFVLTKHRICSYLSASGSGPVRISAANGWPQRASQSDT